MNLDIRITVALPDDLPEGITPKVKVVTSNKAKSTYPDKVCPVCNTTFPPVSKQQKYCSDRHRWKAARMDQPHKVADHETAIGAVEPGKVMQVPRTPAFPPGAHTYAAWHKKAVQEATVA